MANAQLDELTYEKLNAMTVLEHMQLLQVPGAQDRVKEILNDHSRTTTEVGEKIDIASLTYPSMMEMIRKKPALFKELRKSKEGREKTDQLIADENARRGQLEAGEEITEQPVEVQAEIPAGPTPEEVQAEEARRVAEAAEAEVTREAAARLEEAKRAETPKRFVIDFQAKDDSGNPIGRKTHLEASSQEELQEKMLQSYEHAVRALDRARKQKPTFRKEEPVITITDEELKIAAEDLNSDDSGKRVDAFKKLAAAQTEQDRQQARAAEAKATAERESLLFLKSHLTDYNNCAANNQMLADYIKDNDLEWTHDNLEIAFDNLESQLAAPVTAASVSTSASAATDNTVNPAAAAVPVVASAVPVAPPAVPVAAPAAAAPANVPPAAPVANPTPAPPARRPGVNGGLVPGQSATEDRLAHPAAASTSRGLE